MNKKILILYKNTVYSRYKRNKVLSTVIDPLLLKRQLERLRNAHEEHTQTLHHIRDVLAGADVPFDEYFRGGKIPFSNYEVIISVGGDGTFLKAAAGATTQLLIGVNSAPSTSVGRLCVARKENFADVIQRLKKKRVRVTKLHRLALNLADGGSYPVLNDVLFAHENPAVISRYLIKLGRVTEEQRSSGIWVSTAVGSTGAIGSAGGKTLPRGSSDIQYLPRELYTVFGRKYQLRGGIIKGRQSLTIHSLMPFGKIFIDGGNQTVALPYGRCCQITNSKHPIRTIEL